MRTSFNQPEAQPTFQPVEPASPNTPSTATMRGSEFLHRKLTIDPHIAGRKFLF